MYTNYNIFIEIYDVLDDLTWKGYTFHQRSVTQVKSNENRSNQPKYLKKFYEWP